MWTNMDGSLASAPLPSMRKKNLFETNISLFWTYFPSTSWGLRIWSYNLHIFCQNNFWTPIDCSLSFVMFSNTIKIRRNLFFHSKSRLFSKNLCFQQRLERYRNDLTTSTKVNRITSGARSIFPWVLSYSTKHEGKRPISFAIANIAFSWKVCF